MPTRQQCIAEAAAVFAQARLELASRPPRESAIAAWTPSCGMTVDELEEDIRQHLAAATKPTASRSKSGGPQGSSTAPLSLRTA